MPKADIGAPNLTMAVSPAAAAEMEVGATYRFDATKVDEPVSEEGSEHG